MTATHNHPPRCCCAHECNCGGSKSMHAMWCMGRPCPVCPEHGDFAQPDAPIKGVMTQTRECRYPIGDHGDGRGCQHDDCPRHGEPSEPQPGECPTCHQSIGRPHTDYCQITGTVSTMTLPLLEAAGIPVVIDHDMAPDTIRIIGRTSQPDTRTTHALSDKLCPSCKQQLTGDPGEGCFVAAAHEFARALPAIEAIFKADTRTTYRGVCTDGGCDHEYVDECNGACHHHHAHAYAEPTPLATPTPRTIACPSCHQELAMGQVHHCPARP